MVVVLLAIYPETFSVSGCVVLFVFTCVHIVHPSLYCCVDVCACAHNLYTCIQIDVCAGVVFYQIFQPVTVEGMICCIHSKIFDA